MGILGSSDSRMGGGSNENPGAHGFDRRFLNA